MSVFRKSRQKASISRHIPDFLLDGNHCVSRSRERGKRTKEEEKREKKRERERERERERRKKKREIKSESRLAVAHFVTFPLPY